MKLKSLAILLPALFMSGVANADDFKNDKERLSYIFGMQVGQNMMMEGVELQMDAFTMGIEDQFAEKEPRLDKDEAERVIGEMQQRKATELAEVMNVKQAEATKFLEANKTKEGVTTTASGLQYRVITKGDGASPGKEDSVIAHYKGTLLDGTVFDSSYDRGEPSTFPVNGVIAGWQEALPLMKEGAKWELIIPADLAYGPRGAGPVIGPNETLVFEIELIAITAAK